ncbi:hypothetical protein B296_00017635 [Ensete ventricosum]|uniref:Uncharacterized protein n=1 Tax=Ensete ventricosum TaxID=4639 RepID=A0A426YFQ3_ENSVE|nr:hypothetical protein B296_00017635 [Ensete ventricosum]
MFAEGVGGWLGVHRKLAKGDQELARKTSGVPWKKTKRLIRRSSGVAGKLAGHNYALRELAKSEERVSSSSRLGVGTLESGVVRSAMAPGGLEGISGEVTSSRCRAVVGMEALPEKRGVPTVLLERLVTGVLLIAPTEGYEG